MGVQHVAPGPEKGKMYGLLHEMDGTPVQRQVRILKVGIGVPIGPDVHVAIDPKDGKWLLEVGKYSNGKRTGADFSRFDTKAEAMKHYRDARKSAPERKFPRKLPYFTFLRMGADGMYSHDFDAIERHGAIPAELPLVFLNDDPLDAKFQWYTASELKCEGDGRNARRRLDLATSESELKLAEQAKAVGDRFFPIIEGCYARECQYPKGEKPVCKPHARLYFQLVNSPRIGGTCSYDTTGFRSTQQMFTGIEQIRAITGGRVAGIPLLLVLRPYKTSHNGKATVQYGVSLEYRGSSSVTDLVRSIVSHDQEFQAARAGDQSRQIAAPMEEVDPDVDAPAMAAEFYEAEWEESPEDESGADRPLQVPQRRTE